MAAARELSYLPEQKSSHMSIGKIKQPLPKRAELTELPTFLFIIPMVLQSAFNVKNNYVKELGKTIFPSINLFTLYSLVYLVDTSGL